MPRKTKNKDRNINQSNIQNERNYEENNIWN